MDKRLVFARRFRERSRRRKFEHFLGTFEPKPETRVLDVGLSNTADRLENFLEAWYPWPERVVGVSIGPLDAIRKINSRLGLARANGLLLPFPDQTFDVAFSNAVIEHVGSREQQRTLVTEMLRVARTVFITTPDRHFVLDPHTLTPFFHWLPVPQRSRIYSRIGQGFWAGEHILNPLSANDFFRMFPRWSSPSLTRGRILGLSATLTIVARNPRSPATGG